MEFTFDDLKNAIEEQVNKNPTTQIGGNING